VIALVERRYHEFAKHDCNIHNANEQCNSTPRSSSLTLLKRLSTTIAEKPTAPA
jgi:hypothetical protein